MNLYALTQVMIFNCTGKFPNNKAINARKLYASFAGQYKVDFKIFLVNMNSASFSILIIFACYTKHITLTF